MLCSGLLLLFSLIFMLFSPKNIIFPEWCIAGVCGRLSGMSLRKRSSFSMAPL